MKYAANTKKRSKAPAIIASLILIIALAAGGFAGYKLWEQNQVYAEGNALYDEVAQLAVHDLNQSESIPQTDIDWPGLKEVNNDTIAWLYCPDTPIDYPVVKANDYDYYLRHLVNGEYNLNGTLFLDYNNPPDFSGKISVIYGHHMKSGRMFGTLVGYKEQGYYNEHPYMYLYREEGNYRINLKYGFVIGVSEWSQNGYMLEENVDKLLEYAKAHTTFTSNTGYVEGDRWIALSTCSYEFDNARYVVVGVLEPESVKS